MISILIADDHPIVRRGLKQIVQDEKDMNVIGEVSNGDELLEFLSKEKINVLLLDITMPGKSGLDLIGVLKNLFPDLPILVLSGLPEETYAKRVIKMGALGYIHKESAPDLLVPAIRKVYQGKRYISNKLAEILASGISNDDNNLPHEKLSDREFEVLIQIGKGNIVSAIAETLSLSVTTISTYRARILEKMNLKNNSELIQYCLKNNLVE
jgi:two-component system, NarL family, invasion response regulator UvrY